MPRQPADEVLAMREILLSGKRLMNARDGQQHSKTPSTNHTAVTATIPRERSLQLAAGDVDPGLAKVMQMLQTGDTNGIFYFLFRVFRKSMALPRDKRGGYSSDEILRMQQEREMHREIISRLSPLTFSELLRSVDPFLVSQKMDPLEDMFVSPAMAKITPVGEAFGKFGVRKLYAVLFRVLWYILRRRSQRIRGAPQLLPNDFVVLMRAAGAATDRRRARKVWDRMGNIKKHEWRHAGIFADFVRARFLTKKLYMQNDVARMRVRPINLMMYKLNYSPSRLRRLDRLRYKSQYKMTHRFGYDKSDPTDAQHLTRAMAGTIGPAKIYTKAAMKNGNGEIPFQAAYLTVLGRNASVLQIMRILANKWDVRVRYHKHDNADEITRLSTDKSGKTVDAKLYPTPELFESIVHALACNAEVPLALDVLTHMSQRYSVHVPDNVWFELLNWASVMSSKQFAREWQIAGFHARKKLPQDAVSAIWTMMTSEPYNVKPGFQQYDQLIRSLLKANTSVMPALKLMRQMKPLYQAQLREQAEATMALAEVRALGHADGGASTLRLQRAVSKKWHMWHCIHTWCMSILTKSVRENPGSELIARRIPQLVDEFRPFFLNQIWYEIPTGKVCLREPHNHSKLVRERVSEPLPRIRPRNHFFSAQVEYEVPTEDGAAPENTAPGFPDRPHAYASSGVRNEEHAKTHGMKYKRHEEQHGARYGQRHGQVLDEYNEQCDERHDDRYGQIDRDSEYDDQYGELDSQSGRRYDKPYNDGYNDRYDDRYGDQYNQYRPTDRQSERQFNRQYDGQYDSQYGGEFDAEMDEPMDDQMDEDGYVEAGAGIDRNREFDEDTEELEMYAEAVDDNTHEDAETPAPYERVAASEPYDPRSVLSNPPRIGRKGFAVVDKDGRVLTKMEQQQAQREVYPLRKPLWRFSVRDRAAHSAPFGALFTSHTKQRKFLIREFA